MIKNRSRRRRMKGGMKEKRKKGAKMVEKMK